MRLFVVSTVLLFVGLVSAQDELSPELIALLQAQLQGGEGDLAALLAGSGQYREAQDRPNVLLLVADDMGVGDLTVYGHPTQEPGFIDQMAAQGIRFTDAYVGDSVCTPSRSAFMTGKLNSSSFENFDLHNL